MSKHYLKAKADLEHGGGFEVDPGGDHPDHARVVHPQGPRGARHADRAVEGCPLSPSRRTRSASSASSPSSRSRSWPGSRASPRACRRGFPGGGDRARGRALPRRRGRVPRPSADTLACLALALAYRVPALVHPWGWVNRDGAYGAFVGLHLRRGPPPGAGLHRGRELPGHAQGAHRGRSLAARHRRLVVPDRPGRRPPLAGLGGGGDGAGPPHRRAASGALHRTVPGPAPALPRRLLAQLRGPVRGRARAGRDRAGARRGAAAMESRAARCRRPARRRDSSSGPRSGSSRSRCPTSRPPSSCSRCAAATGLPWAVAGFAVGVLPVVLWNAQNDWASGDIMGRDPGELRAQADALPRLLRRTLTISFPILAGLAPGHPWADVAVARLVAVALIPAALVAYLVLEGRGHRRLRSRARRLGGAAAAAAAAGHGRASPGPPRPARCTGGRGTCCRWSRPPRSISASCWRGCGAARGWRPARWWRACSS